MVLVFDMDDTLFDELSFVRSGFAAVAAYVAQKRGVPAEIVRKMCEARLAAGRSGIFDAVFGELDIYSRSFVRQCVRVYRCHRPEISLYPEAARCLARFSSWPIYIVTDGNVTAQRGKLEALGLYGRPPVKRCFLTWRHGRKHGKPSPYCFRLICGAENVAPEQVVYVGDNPAKDFVGIRPLGFRTVRVLTGQHRDVKTDAAHAADVEIENLDMLDRELLAGLGLMEEAA